MVRSFLEGEVSLPDYRAYVLDKCKTAIEFQLWPPEMESRLEPWLANFEPHEQEHAYYLLGSFLFFSEKLVRQMFLAAFHDLSSRVRKNGRSIIGERPAWRHFFDRVIITQVMDEHPSPADSGHIFARHARDLIGIDQAQIVSNQEALQILLAQRDRPVVFVDDFVGSGHQFITTWTRSHNIAGANGISFKRIAASQPQDRMFFAYCPALCTSFGASEIQKHCPEVIISPGNFVSAKYSALANDSIIWPRHLMSSAFNFVEQVSRRAQIPDSDGDVGDWRGYKKQGLCLAFNHGMPDASLPIFSWSKNGWNPLVRYN
jgi:hypothetical protein